MSTYNQGFGSVLKKSTRLIWVAWALLFCQPLTAAEFTIAVRAKSGVEQAADQWQATVDYLSRQLPGHTFRLRPIVSLDEISAVAGRGEIDLVITNPSSFIDLRDRYGATALATLNNRRADTAQSRFGAVIFTHVKNEGIVTLKDLRGKRVMAVSESAFGGWLVAWRELLKQGINPRRDLKALLFAGGIQDDVVYAVRDGRADVGVVRTDQLERMEAAGLIDMRYFRVINNQDVREFPFFLSSPLYPEWAFVALKGVPAGVAGQIQQLLLTLAADSQAARNGHYVGWVMPLDYGPVVDLLKSLNVTSGGD